MLRRKLIRAGFFVAGQFNRLADLAVEHTAARDQQPRRFIKHGARDIFIAGITGQARRMTGQGAE